MRSERSNQCPREFVRSPDSHNPAPPSTPPLPYVGTHRHLETPVPCLHTEYEVPIADRIRSRSRSRAPCWEVAEIEEVEERCQQNCPRAGEDEPYKPRTGLLKCAPLLSASPRAITSANLVVC